MQPTYLYIKRHKVTGLLYFGKTSKDDPIKYRGSGKYWKAHYIKHGRDLIETVWYELFHDQEEMTKFALAFSEIFDIAQSEDWANFIHENGLDGAPTGHNYTRGRKQTQAHKDAVSQSLKGKKKSPEAVEKMRLKKIGFKHTEETKARIAAKSRGRKHSEETRRKISQALRTK